MKKIYFITLSFLLISGVINFTYCQEGWFSLSVPSLSYNTIYFVDNNTGFTGNYYQTWMQINGNIFKTTDGGANWTNIYPASPGIIRLFFVNGETGFALSETNSYSLFLKTTNGGNNWTSQSGLPNYNLYFHNSNTGYLCGGSNIYKTINGGNNWTAYNIGLARTNLTSITFTDLLNGFSAGYQTSSTPPLVQSVFCKTTNGGLNWVPTILNYENFLYSLNFVNNNTGYLVGGQNENYNPQNCLILKTTNGGATFVVQLSGLDRSLISSYFLNESTGYAVGCRLWYSVPNIILKTTNGGNNWYQQTLPVNNALRSVFFLNSEIGFVAGSGVILKTINGGVTGILPINNVLPDKYNLSQNYPNPFNPSTVIKFDIPEHGIVKLKVFDVLGREVASLVNEEMQPGSYEASFNGEDLPSGIYFYSLVTPSFNGVKKMILIK